MTATIATSITPWQWT